MMFPSFLNDQALDPNMSKHSLMAEWLSFAEELSSFLPRARDGFQLLPYISTVAAAVYVYCAVGSNRRPKIEWPRRYVVWRVENNGFYMVTCVR
jgi:hypothetical protein